MKPLTTGELASAPDETQNWGTLETTSERRLSDKLQQLDEVSEREDFERLWTVLNEEFPHNPDVWKARVQRLIKDKLYDEAISEIDSCDLVCADEDALL